MSGNNPDNATSPEAPSVAIKRVLSETWLDGPGKAKGRQRIRVVEADFKYRFLRMRESVATDRVGGDETVELLEASVADHLMIGIRAGVSTEAAEAAIANYGYEIRAVEAGSYLLAVIPDFQSDDSHEKAIADLSALEEFVDYAEPDFLVFPAAPP